MKKKNKTKQNKTIERKNEKKQKFRIRKEKKMRICE